MKLRIGQESYTGDHIDLRRQSGDVRGSTMHGGSADGPSATSVDSASAEPPTSEGLPPATLVTRIATAIETGGPGGSTGTCSDAQHRVEVDCPTPAPYQEPLRTHPTDASLRAVLAAAARSRGLTASVDDALAERREALRDLRIPDVDLEAARKRLAAASGDADRLRERVAALRGELRAHRDLDADADAVREELSEATTALSKAETERIAAEQALDRAVERARDARDARERRLELEDEVANLERDARRELAAELRPRVRDALDAIPEADPAPADGSPEPLGGDVAAALATVRAASLEAPVVLGPSIDRFDSVAAAHDALGCPVIRI